MTIYVQFVPSPTTNFQFQAVFDNATYSIVVTWNYYGQRYYVNCYTIQGELVYCLPLVGSPDEFGINLNGGYFGTTFVFRVSSNNFEIG